MIVNTPANGVRFEYIDLTDFFTRFLLIAPAYGAMNKKFISINELEPDTVANGRIGSMLSVFRLCCNRIFVLIRLNSWFY